MDRTGPLTHSAGAKNNKRVYPYADHSLLSTKIDLEAPKAISEAINKVFWTPLSKPPKSCLLGYVGRYVLCLFYNSLITSVVDFSRCR